MRSFLFLVSLTLGVAGVIHSADMLGQVAADFAESRPTFN